MHVLRVHTNPNPPRFGAVRDRLADEDDVAYVNLVEGQGTAAVEILLDVEDGPQVSARERELRRIVADELDNRDDPVEALRRDLAAALERIVRLETLPAIEQALQENASQEPADPSGRR